MAEQEFAAQESQGISSLVREELAKRRLTRASLADKAKISLSTLEKALSGQRSFTLATVVRLEEALGLHLRNGGPARDANKLAPEWLGSYARPAVNWLEGNYFTIRPSFSQPGAVYTYMTEILWDKERGHLAFSESERKDANYKHDGDVSVPHQSGYVYLVTNRHGQYRLAMLSRPAITGEMFGILTTLQSGKGAALTPTSVPIVLAPVAGFGKSITFGRLGQDHEMHSRCHNLLRRVTEEPFAHLLNA